MDRRIKFKVWDPIIKSLDGPFTIDDMIDGNYPQEYDNYSTPGLRDDLVLLQYTGILDINAREIYEGDMVMDREYYEDLWPIEGMNDEHQYICPMVVSWINSGWSGRYIGYDITDKMTSFGKYEIMGNKYDVEDFSTSTFYKMKDLVEDVEFDLDKTLEEQGDD